MRHKKAWIVGLIAIVTMSLMVLDQTHLTVDDTPAPPESSNAAVLAPDVTFTLLEGGTVSLRSLQGHRIWLHFWASWCAPCKEEFPQLLTRLQKEDGNTILLAVSGDAKPNNARTFLTPLRQQFPGLFARGRIINAIDPEHTLIEGTFQTFQYPETIMIGPDDRMEQKISGIFKP